MAKVNLNINGKQYALGCDDGEEGRLERFGAILDGKVTDLADQFGQIGDLRLMVMAGITLLDEVDDLRRERDSSISVATRTLERESQAALSQAETIELTAVDSLNTAAEAIEKLAVKFRRDDQAL